jgi:hypothetical protein
LISILFRFLSKSVGWFFPLSLISIVWWIGSKGRRSLRRDFTRTLDSGPSVGVHPDPARHYRRSSCLVAQNQGPGGAQSLRHAGLPPSGSPGKFFFILMIFRVSLFYFFPSYFRSSIRAWSSRPFLFDSFSLLTLLAP